LTLDSVNILSDWRIRNERDENQDRKKGELDQKCSLEKLEFLMDSEWVIK